jgi:peptidoglycan/xylan/chitin deacetylase (PgdA/CDA1 family)
MRWLLDAVLDRLRLQMYRSLFRQPLLVAPENPIVSFTFDDFPSSAYREGGRILQSHGALGTYYVSFSLMGKESDLWAHFTHGDIESLLDDGHELACHTYRHLNGRDTDPAEYFADVSRNSLEAARLFPGIRLANFSYPFGAVTLGTKRSLGSRFRSCRATTPGINVGNTDLKMLRTNRLYEDRVPLRHVEKLIEENARRRGWLLFYTHDVSEAPSHYGCSPGYFEAVVRAAIESGGQLLPVGSALDRLAS